jgi:hypothetical protein
MIDINLYDCQFTGEKSSVIIQYTGISNDLTNKFAAVIARKET